MWNEYIYQKDKGIENKQTIVGLNCCQNTHCGKNRTGEGIWLSSEYLITTDAKCHMEIRRSI